MIGRTFRCARLTRVHAREHNNSRLAGLSPRYSLESHARRACLPRTPIPAHPHPLEQSRATCERQQRHRHNNNSFHLTRRRPPRAARSSPVTRGRADAVTRGRADAVTRGRADAVTRGRAHVVYVHTPLGLGVPASHTRDTWTRVPASHTRDTWTRISSHAHPAKRRRC